MEVDWRDRFRAPAVTFAQVARDEASRGVVITDIADKFQAYAWDRSRGSIRQVTDAKGAIIASAISRDGNWIYAMVENEAGTEIGHLHRFSFDGSYSEDVTPGLPYYTSFGFAPTLSGLVAVAGIEGKQALLVVDAETVRVIHVPSLVQGLAVTKDGTRAAVTMTTPGQGMVPMMHVLDLESEEVLYELPNMRGGAILDEQVAVSYVDGEWAAPAIWSDGSVTPLKVRLDGSVTPVDWSEDGSTILLSQSFRSSSQLHLYHVETGEVTQLISPPGATYPMSYPSLVDAQRALSIWSDANNPWRVFELGPEGYEVSLQLEEQKTFPGPLWEEFTFSSTGGIEIQGWLLRPEREGPWPTILYTHGGPTSVSGPSFAPISSAWYDSGFAVAAINYRGSTTFGESFREALTGNLGGPDVEDVVAARNWLVDQGIAEPDSIVKNGYSYGGYLTLQGLGTHPDLWAAGVAGAPIADWKMAYEDSNDVLKGYFVSMWGGTPDELGEAMVKGSPLTYAANYEAPLLISQPEGDSRTPLRPVRTFVETLKENGKEVDLRIMSAGHAGAGISQTIEMMESWIDFAKRAVGLA
ncbi:MAG: prolyl oligopeptidase family serine peptidase [Acidimicrobiia bacterium]|nr:prolyl oligopeptidase family serine peptidase [Acidimicrobiia bacterium]